MQRVVADAERGEESTDAPDGERGEAQPAPGQFGDGRGVGVGRARRVGEQGGPAVQQVPAQGAGLGGGDPVQPQRAGRRPTVHGGADAHRGEPEEAVQRAGGEVGAADPLQRDRAAAAEEQARAEFEAVLGDPVAGGEQPHQVEAADDGEGRRQRAQGDQC